MSFLYDIFIKLVATGIYFAARLGNKKAQQWLEGRKNWQKKLKNVTFLKPVFWFHCASLGEFEQGRPLLESVKEKMPETFILLTFYSPSGYEIRKNYAFADFVCYLPLDTRRNAKIFLAIVQPAAAIFVKYEFWIRFLNQLFQQKIPTYLVSAVFRPDQIFFRPYGNIFFQLLPKYTQIFVQNQFSSDLLKKNGVTNNVTIAGDTRVDSVVSFAKNVAALPPIASFKGDANIFIAGSTWEADEKILLASFNSWKEKNWKFIIAPHEIDKKNIENICNKLTIKWIRYSETDIEKLAASQILIIDNIGTLASAYQYAKIAYIGGGFGRGIHNILEPMAFGLPVIFGTNYEKFEEAKTAVANKAAFSIKNRQEFDEICQKLMSQIQYNESSEAAKKYVTNNVGATEKIWAQFNLLR